MLWKFLWSARLIWRGDWDGSREIWWFVGCCFYGNEDAIMASFRLSPRDRWGMLQSVTFTYFIIYFCFFRNTLFEYSSSGRSREIPLVRRFVRFFKGIDFFHEYFVTAKPIYGCKKKRKNSFLLIHLLVLPEFHRNISFLKLISKIRNS